MWAALILICDLGSGDCATAVVPRHYDTRDQCLYDMLTAAVPMAQASLPSGIEVRDGDCFGWGDRVANSRGSS
jgi:hypothetical protein